MNAALSEDSAIPARLQQLFATIDSGDAVAFARFLTPHGSFRFGNAPPAVGRVAIEAAVAGFFTSIRRCDHRLLRCWIAPGSEAVQGEVTYTRLDGSRLTVPFVNVFLLEGALIRDYQIHIDASQLYATPTG